MAIKLTVQAAFQSRKGAVIGREFKPAAAYCRCYATQLNNIHTN